MIDSQFMKAIEEITDPKNLLSSFLKVFLEEKRIALLPLQFQKIVEGIENENLVVSIYWFNLLQSPLKKKAAVEYLESFPDYVEQSLPKLETVFLDSIEGTVNTVLADTSRRITDHLFKTRAKMFRNRDQIAREYRKLVRRTWKEEINLLRMVLEVSKEIHENLGTEAEVDESFRWKLLRKFLEQGCLVTSEIVVLLQNGYPDAALSRWRTIHELAVVLLFLQ